MTTDEDPRLGVVANAIGWSLYSVDGRDIESSQTGAEAIMVTKEEAERCRVIARRVLTHLNDYDARMASPLATHDYIDVVFDGPPDAEAGRFVEVEDPEGRSVNAGQWIDRGRLWALRIRRAKPLAAVTRKQVEAAVSAHIEPSTDVSAVTDAIMALAERPLFTDQVRRIGSATVIVVPESAPAIEDGTEIDVFIHRGGD